MRLKNKRTLVTGGARGIGKGIVKRFLEEGAKVIALDKRKEDLLKTIEEYKNLNSEVDYLVCDLAERARVSEVAESAWERWGGIDILVNNAGIASRESFIDISISGWENILNVNLNAMFILSQSIVKQMIEDQSAGSIVNMGSKNGLAAGAKLTHYNVSKAGINLLTQSMAVELAKFNIRVNSVAPGFIETPLDTELKQKDEQLSLTERTPMKRLGSVTEVANAVLFLASDEASYITGTTLVVDGGHLANASEF